MKPRRSCFAAERGGPLRAARGPLPCTPVGAARRVFSRRVLRVIGNAALAAVVLGGCATVEPWDRGALLKPHMAVDPFPMRSAWRGHVENSRQAAPSGHAAEGGACGCY